MGGCGNTPAIKNPQDCNDPLAPYYDICPDTNKSVAEDYTCPTVTRLDCTINPAVYPATCYWKGAAFYSDATPDASLHPPNFTQGTSAGIHRMLKQRLAQQGKGDKTTPDGIPLLTYWNEITMDGKILKAMLKHSPKSAVAGMIYKKGSAQAYGFAKV